VTILSQEIRLSDPGLSARKNRNKFQITQAILEVAREGAGKTRIMYRANLSFKLLEDYLGALVRSGLLKVKEGERKMFLTSERGLQFLREFEDLERNVALVSAKKDSLARLLAKGS